MRCSSLFALLVCCRIVLGVEYDEVLSRKRFFVLAAAAYSREPEECLNLKFNNTEVLNKYIAPCDLRGKNKCFSFIGVDHDSKALIISFRGSTSPEQVVHEVLDTITKPEVKTFNGTKVGYYFYHAFDLMWKQEMKFDVERYIEKFKNYEIWITGHSLGGAIASLCATTIAYNNPKISDKLVLYTYGEPRVGDRNYAELAEKSVKNAFRIIHHRDIVANIPIVDAKRFWHHSTPIFYKNDMTKGTEYIVCEESDLRCTLKHMGFQTSIKDHLHYYDTHISDYGENNCRPLKKVEIVETVRTSEPIKPGLFG